MFKVTLTAALLAGAALMPVVGTPAHAAIQQTPQAIEDIRLNDFLELYFQSEVDESPTFQTRLGIKGDRYGEWTDTSDAAAKRDVREAKFYLSHLKKSFDRAKLSDQAKLSYDYFVYAMEQQIDNARFRRQNYVVNQFRGQFAQPLTLLQNNHRIADISDARAFISRVAGLEGQMADMILRMRDRFAFGVVAPDFAFPPMIETAEGLLKGAPLTAGDDHPLMANFKDKLKTAEIAAADQAVLIAELTAAMTGPFKRGYDAIVAELKAQAPQVTDAKGVWALPDGAAFYQNRIKNYTTLDLTADDIHQIGLDDVARIHGEMRAIMAEVGFQGSLQAFFQFIRTDPNNFYDNSDAGRAAFLADARQQTEEIFAVADQYFHTLPKADLEVRRVEPWREDTVGIAFYNRPSQDGSRPGIYYANLADMTGVQKYVFRAITYHEGVPGHHFQIAKAQELSDLPTFRKFTSYSAFTEGWALYSEQLAGEMGFFKDPYYNFGRLQDEIWRSVRLVVDTGIHHKRWTRQQAIDYFTENTPISPQDIVTEVERYFVLPGQALSYKMGMIKILELRAKAQAALGDAYDIRDFHSAVLDQGFLTLGMLEDQVNAYIEAKKE